MKIENSLQWDTVRTELNRQIQALPYDRSVRLMLKNIDDMIVNLSRQEVDARRTKVSYYTEETLAKVNESIDNLEKILLLAMLTHT